MVRGLLVPVPPFPVGCEPRPLKVDKPRVTFGSLDICNIRISCGSFPLEPKIMCSFYEDDSQVGLSELI